VHTHSGGRFFRWAAVLLVAFAAVGACRLADDSPPSSVFTPAHSSVRAAVNDFLNLRPDPTQPFPFPHSTHVAQKIMCTEYCHESVVKGPIAGLPGVKTCMICHESIAVDRPLIKTLADYARRGIDISWQRVYGYAGEAHVRFNHAPHIRAKVECTTCHGSIAQQTVARRNVDLNMGFCVDCHKSKQAPNECITCHF
jgi:cytochrome c7-like protein